MQTKHLQRLLLTLLLTGCGGENLSSDNPYLTDKKTVNLSFSGETSAPVVLFGNIDLSVPPPSSAPEPFVLQIYPHTGGRWIGGIHVDGFDRRSVRVSRTLSSLIVEDTVSGLRYAASVLPKHAGIAFYLEGETYSPVQFTLAHTSKDTPFLRGNKTGEREVYLFPDSFAIVLRAKPDFLKPDELFGGAANSFARELDNGRQRHIILAFARDPEAAEEIAKTYLGMKREQLERAARDSLANGLAFSLHTKDDRTNRAFALLAATLTEAEERISLSSPGEIKESASLSRALFLASRERPRVAFGADAKDLPQRVRWGSEAFRAALAYGMADEDSLKQAALDVLTEVARLNREYADNLFALGDDEIPDTMMRLAVAHVRYAELLTLCGDISIVRGDRNAESSFRKEAQRAARNARRFFRESEKIYRSARMKGSESELSRLEMFFAESDSEEADITITTVTATSNPPDTLRYVREGAFYGFAWLAERPSGIIPDSLDGFIWQKWTAYRFASDYSITQTPDLDSLVSLLLQGPLPGALTTDPGHGGEPSLPVMAAAFQNIVELYLGIQPDWLRQRVEILPRPPLPWGHTVARVPLGPGFLHLDFDFENSRAVVSMSDIGGKLDVFFGYPLPSGGFVRTQFALSPEQPRVRIRMERDSENRVKLNVKEG